MQIMQMAKEKQAEPQSRASRRSRTVKNVKNNIAGVLWW
jgi:hypothetical protein